MNEAFQRLTRDEGRRLNEREFTLLDGAMNLLSKALERQVHGEDDRADRLVARAAAMPYDARMEGSPGVRGAEQLVFELVSDSLEDSDEDDMSWLTAAIDAHARLDEVGRTYLASTLHGFVLQDAFYNTSRVEQRLIRARFGEAPLEADLGDGPDLTVEGRERIIRSLLASYHVLEEEYQRTG